MLFCLFIACIFLQIRPAYFTECKINKDYHKLVLSPSPITLCVDVGCTSNIEILNNDAIYANCKIHNNVFPLKIQISEISTIAIKAVKCLTKYGWVTKNENYLCESFNNLVFKAYPNIAEAEFYVVGCDDQESEFPLADSPRIQISGFEGFQENGVSREFLFFPTFKLTCVPACQGVSITWETNNTAIAGIKSSTVIIKTDIPEAEYSKLTAISCKSAKSVTRTISFYVANEFSTSIYTDIGGTPRIPPLTYDAGEKLSCTVTGRNTYNVIAGQPPPSKISLAELDRNLNILSVYTQNASKSVIIPDNLKTRFAYGAICHFGPYKSQSEHDYFLIQKWKINILAKYLTKLRLVHSDDILHEYNFLPNTKIKCNASYYGKSDPIELYILYGKLVAYPKSVLSNYNNTQFHNASGEMNFEKKFHNRQLYAFCNIDGQITTPVDVFAGDKPQMNIIYVHPKWKSEYHLAGFTMICNTSNVEEVSLMCLDCMPDTRMEITKVSANQMKLTVPKSLRKNAYITYKCIGISTKYLDISELIHLKVIVSERTGMDTSNDILNYGTSSLNCISTFTIVVKNVAVTQTIRLPPQMKIDNGPVINQDGSSESIKLVKKESAFLGSNEVVKFTGCCPVFYEDKYVCTDEWQPILVTRSYTVRFNLNLKNLYAGNVMRCFICVTYTDEVTPAFKCENRNQVKTLIRTKVKHPDGAIKFSSYEEEIQVPREQLKPDKKSFYKITDYEIDLQCKVNNEFTTERITIKSCNSDPPPISISPPDKSMFVVGDIISCTTDSLHCRYGLNYIIYIQYPGSPLEKNEIQSITLSTKHIGNSIVIKCTAGEGEKSKAERLVRVEMEPFNVSINILKHIMVYRRYLRCNAQGFPPPSVTWSQTAGPSSLMISEHFLLIGPWDFSGNYTIHCEAKNERGIVTKTASFQIFNPRITSTDYSVHFYLFIPLLTLCYVIFLVLSLIIIFQENIFGVPFFCGGVAAKEKKEIKDDLDLSKIETEQTEK